MLDQANELALDRDHFFHPSTHMGAHARRRLSRAGGRFGRQPEPGKAWRLS
ncbi:hypothetical protein [Mesorhizobium sp.]|uniref:hypothetical protein n=1 Tax=Mesorhizobium sp. TaxID=1871066 RepID=UPI00356B5838